MHSSWQATTLRSRARRPSADTLGWDAQVVSCLTVTGLNSVLLASLTTWQQVILFVSRSLDPDLSPSRTRLLRLSEPALTVQHLGDAVDDDDRVNFLSFNHYHRYPSVG